MSEVATTTGTEVSTDVNDLGEWGLEDQVIDSKDVVLPRLWLMQALSEAVAEKEIANSGDIINSVTEEVLAEAGDSINVVPIKFEKLWFVMEKSDDKGKMLAVEPVTPANAARGKEGSHEGVPCTYIYALRFYVLVEGEALPAVVTFKSTGLRAGKQLLTESWVKNIKAGKNPASRYMALSAEKQKNDKGVYYVFNVRSGEDTAVDTQQEALQWVKTLKQNAPKIAGEEVETVVTNEESETY